MSLYNPTGSDDRTTIRTAAADPLGRETSDACAGFARWLDHIESVIERYPWPTLLLALGIGYALSRKMR